MGLGASSGLEEDKYNMGFKFEAEHTRLSDVLEVGMRDRCQEFLVGFWHEHLGE